VADVERTYTPNRFGAESVATSFWGVAVEFCFDQNEESIMGSRGRLILRCIGLALGGGILLAGPGTSCTAFSAATAAASLDTSFIFDCQNAGGGTFDLTTFLIDCAPQATP